MSTGPDHSSSARTHPTRYQIERAREIQLNLEDLGLIASRKKKKTKPKKSVDFYPIAGESDSTALPTWL